MCCAPIVSVAFVRYTPHRSVGLVVMHNPPPSNLGRAISWAVVGDRLRRGVVVLKHILHITAGVQAKETYQAGSISKP